MRLGVFASGHRMIRVLVKASSPIAKAGLQSLLQAHSALRLIDESAGDGRGVEVDSPPDVLLVEAGTFADPAARKAVDWAGAGGAVVMLFVESCCGGGGGSVARGR